MEERFFDNEQNLEEINEDLRKASLKYKELKERHAVSMEMSIKDRLHKVVYYSNPNSVFTKNTEVQSKFRQELVNKIA